MDEKLEESSESQKDPVESSFNEDMIRKYPKANKKVQIEVTRYGITAPNAEQEKGQSIHIRPGLS